MRLTLILLALTFQMACSSTPDTRGADIGERLNDSDYQKLIHKYTDHIKDYKGFHNTFQVYATLVNSEIQSALIQRESDALQWDQDKATNEREKAFQEMSNETKVIVSLYTPTSKYNDLHKGISIWKLYLEANGKRYEGSAMKKDLRLIQLKKLYPYHNRWSQAYEVSFNVPTSVAESSDTKFIMASSLGKAELKFSPMAARVYRYDSNESYDRSY
jgi:hypothetical protein